MALIQAKKRPNGLAARLASLLIGQPDAVETIIPFVQMHQAGLGPDGRPIGVILLLGPTGTGKTFSVEALAEVLHGNRRNLLKIDCGEFQMEHEVAKLIGAPPGYLGHRETTPLLNQSRLNAVASEDCNISIVLFDEIEKAAPSMARLLLGILDKATLKLGDNNTVNFEHSLIFMTTNLGARQIQRAAKPDFGFESLLPRTDAIDPLKIKGLGMAAVRRKFSPEFVNRIDSVVTYRPLTASDCEQILGHMLVGLNRLIKSRLGERAPTLTCTPAANALLLKMGISTEWGARELKRTVQREFVQPVAAMIADGEIPDAATVVLDARANGTFRFLVRA
jgi:ATP-dependent Clp protease ATP-binding subunit ClpA